MIGALVLVVVIGVVAYTAFTGGGGDAQNIDTETEEQVKDISPEDIGLELSLEDQNREAVMKLTKLDDIKSIEYEVSYDVVEVDEESGEEIVTTQGATSGDEPILVKSGESEVERSFTLGTCSSGKCRYHRLTSDITFVIKVNYNDGSIGQAEDMLEYPDKEEVTQPE